MYYVKIPVRYLHNPSYPDQTYQDAFARRVEDVKENLKDFHLVGWAFSYNDLASVEVAWEDDKSGASS